MEWFLEKLYYDDKTESKYKDRSAQTRPKYPKVKS